MGEVNGPGTVQGGEKFLTGTESVEHSAKSGGPVTVAGKAKVGEIIESDSRSMIHDIAKAVGKSLSWVHFILKHIWKVQKISASCIPHTCILTDDQIRVGVQSAKQISENVSYIQLKTICKRCW